MMEIKIGEFRKAMREAYKMGHKELPKFKLDMLIDRIVFDQVLRKCKNE